MGWVAAVTTALGRRVSVRQDDPTERGDQSAKVTKPTELARQWRSQTEFGNEGEKQKS